MADISLPRLIKFHYMAITNTTIRVGGAHGIGAATVSLLYGRGAHVYFGNLDEVKGRELVSHVQSNIPQSGGSVHFQKLDVRNYNQQLQLFKTPYEERGHIDIAIACAGVGEPNAWFGQDQLTLEAVKTEPQSLKDTIDINLTSVLLFSRLALAFMKQDKEPKQPNKLSKSIVLVSSIAGLVEAAGLFAYGASKHGVVGLMRSLRAPAKAKYNIRVNVVCPWATDTRMLEHVRAMIDKYQLPLNTPSDVAQFITQLAIDESLSGKCVLVAGGRGFDTEEGMDRSMPEWFGPLTDDFWRGQKAFGTVSTMICLYDVGLRGYLLTSGFRVINGLICKTCHLQ
ncbi:hypothetical protein IL306_010494 [Fusarium sp. DS 682]|nr:hypothetical protein IL306_010494 [Fusarium sp. DS 682]